MLPVPYFFPNATFFVKTEIAPADMGLHFTYIHAESTRQGLSQPLTGKSNSTGLWFEKQ